MITVYTRPNCSQCENVKRHFDSEGVEYETKPITEEVREWALEKGYRTMPIVIGGEEFKHSFAGDNKNDIDDFLEVEMF